MKDPLHNDQTPHEILGVSPGAEKAEVEKAFAKALRNKIPANLAKGARDVLVRPEKMVERVFCEMLLYEEEQLKKLCPSPLEDITVLDPKNRFETAKRWELQLKSSFPDAGIAHCLAVLWYWWTLYEENRQEEMLKEMLKSLPVDVLERERSKEYEDCDCNWESYCSSSAPPLDEMWRRSIAYWSMIAADPGIWNGRLGLSDSDAAEVRRRIKSDLRNRLTDRGQQYSRKLGGDHPLAVRYRQLGVTLLSEMKSAKEVAESGFKKNKCRLCAGVQMMQFMGLLEEMRSSIDQQLKKYPKNRSYQRLQYVLSEYFEIGELLEDIPPRPEEAQQRINALPEKKRKIGKVKQLQGRAFMLKGRQKADVGDVDDALENWGKALDAGMEKEAHKGLEKEVVEFCHSKAMEFRNRDAQRAINILEKGLELVKDEKLERVLGDLLTDKAIEAVNRGQNEIGDRPGTADLQRLKSVLESAKAELEQAIELGSKRAEQNLETVKKELETLKKLLDGTGVGTGPLKIERLLKEANAAAKREDWDTAIDKLREAKRLSEPNIPDPIKKNLATCLINRAIKNANSAYKKMNEKKKDLFENLNKKRSFYGCAKCGKSEYSTGMKSSRWYNVKLADGSEVLLCGKCLEKLKKTEKSPPKHSKVTISLLRSAEKDLMEAKGLNPGDSNIEQTLEFVRKKIPKTKSKIALVLKTLWFVLVLAGLIFLLVHHWWSNV